VGGGKTLQGVHGIHGIFAGQKKNRTMLEQAQASGKLSVMLNSTVGEIHEIHVDIEQDGVKQRFANDAVIVCAGGLLSTPLLQKIGIEFSTKYGTA
jgi:thioredoxin reductase (NADPH)